MESPLSIVFEGMPASEFVDRQVRSEAQKLEKFFDRITAGRVVVEKFGKGHHFAVRIRLDLPGGGTVVVSREPKDLARAQDGYAVIRDAFDAARRQLEDYVRVRRGDVKNRTQA